MDSFVPPPTPPHHPLRGTPDDPDPTPPHGLTLGDRVVLEKRIEVIEAELKLFMTQREREMDRFYVTRMMPLEKLVASLHTRMWFSVGVALGTLMITLAILVTMISLHTQH